MTYDVKKKADRSLDKQSAHAVGAVENDRIDVTSLYTHDEDLSSILPSPLTGVALDGSLTLMGINIEHFPLLVRKAIEKLWFLENQV